MSSFVNMMDDTVWSDIDIINRTEATIARDFPPLRKEILDRKVLGQILNQYTLTADEQAQLTAYSTAAFLQGEAADAARADMVLKGKAMDHEKAAARLALDPNPDNPDDATERAAAQAVVDASDQPTLDLVAQRATFRAALAG